MALQSCQDTGGSQPSHLLSEGLPLALGPILGLNCHGRDIASEPPEPETPARYTCGPGAVSVVRTADGVAVGIRLCPVGCTERYPQASLCNRQRKAISEWRDKHAVWERPGVGPVSLLIPSAALCIRPVAMVNGSTGKSPGGREPPPLVCFFQAA